MIVARIAKALYADDLSGTGSSLLGGRWNSRGRAVLYTASCAALAALEYTVHIGSSAAPTGLQILWIEIPDSLTFEEIWATPSSPAQFLQYGDTWLDQAKHPLLLVPSVLVPKQRNILLNPVHPHASTIRIVERTPFVLDNRLLTTSP